MSPQDEIRKKRATSTKWMKYPQDVLPAWIADMDLGIAPVIAEETKSRIDLGDLGYPCLEIETVLLDAFSDRYIEKFNTPLDPQLGLVATDVVQSIIISLLTLTDPGDGVIVQTPIYPPFLHSVENTGRILLENPLLQSDDSWDINFDQLENLASNSSAKLLLLCSPHNPTGRVFTQRELVKVAEICERYGVLVVADEIHCDIVFQPNYHIPFASISPEFASNVVTMNSATKSFNIAGLRCSIVHFGSTELKSRYEQFNAHVRGSISSLSMLAATVAWQKGDSWLDSVLTILRANRDTLSQFVRKNTFGLRYSAPQGTYLGWLDFRDTKASSSPQDYLLQKARVALSDGSDFGEPGIGWARLNFATQPEILQEILDRISSAFE
ncbi:MAG: pyridoxal phosphate-dependent aminotransferase [Acidimicrobiaceae bacterium]|nr:pyridoxal phosphate-dependent aminotransferase [Acidimicrobiaceae bacterium]